MSTAVKSIFGAYADRMQLMIDRSLDQFTQPWYSRYFSFAPPQMGLTYSSAIGRSRIEAAASVISTDAAAPLRSRPALEKYSGEVAKISEKVKMSESDYRDFLTLQSLSSIDDATKQRQLLDYLFGDIKRVGTSVDSRVDMMCLQAVSTGKVKVDATTNPDGLVFDDIDLLMPAGNKVNASVTWATAASAKPLSEDIPAIVQAAAARGITFDKMLMDVSLWWKFIQIAEVKSLVSNAMGTKQAGNVLISLDSVNSLLSANGWPVIELVNRKIGIEKDGVITSVNPFDTAAVSFVPAGQLGEIKNAVPIERISPIPQVVYANYNQALISKWKQNEPFGEYTKAELVAFPAFTAIDSVYLLKAIL